MSKERDLTSQDDAFEAAPYEEDWDDDLPSEDEDPSESRMTSRQKIILVGIGAGVLLILLGLIVGLLMFSGRRTDDDHILENVYAAGVNLGGMTVEEAISALHLATDPSISREPMIVRVYDDTLMLDPKNTKASLNVEEVVQAAYRYGRSGNQAENQKIRKNAARRTHTIPLLPYLNLDFTLIQNTVNSYCAEIATEYTEPVVTLIGSRPTEDTPSPQHQSIRITLGTPLRQLDADDLYNQILDAYSTNQLLLEYETPEPLWPTEVKAQDLFDQYCTLPKDAVLDPATYQITPESSGYGFSVVALQQLLDDAKPGETVEITMSFLKPTLLAQDINDNLFSQTLSTCKSTSTVDDNGRDVNLRVSCNAINGYVIKPGETFSFKKALGNISKETGYKEAPISAVDSAVLGGGISQTASALYYCALYADLDIVERHNHKYSTDFIELGMDAYVDRNDNDLRFRNNTGTPIRIVASVERHSVFVSLYSENALSYSIVLRSQILSKQLPAASYQMLIPNNSQGYQDGDVITTGVEGYRVSVFKEKLDISSGNVLSTATVSTDDYQKRDEVIARIGTFEAEDAA